MTLMADRPRGPKRLADREYWQYLQDRALLSTLADWLDEYESRRLRGFAPRNEPPPRADVLEAIDRLLG